MWKRRCQVCRFAWMAWYASRVLRYHVRLSCAVRVRVHAYVCVCSTCLHAWRLFGYSVLGIFLGLELGD